MIFDLVIVMSYGLFSFIVGIIIGSMNHTHPNAVENLLVNVHKMVRQTKEKITGEELQVGAYPRPSARDLQLLDEDPKKREAKEEMKKSLDEIPDLKRAKEFVESMRK